MSRVNSALVLLLSCCFSTTAFAELITIEVTINANDAQRRQLTATRNGKTLRLDLAKDVVVSVGGKQADLASLKANQQAVITYETNLQIVTKVEVRGNEASSAVVVPLRELSTTNHEVGPWVSSDGLRIYWHVQTDTDSWIWTASRKSATTLFQDMKRLMPGNDATLSGDEIEMLLVIDGKLHSARRDSKDAPFNRPLPIQELAEYSLNSPCLSEDGLLLYANQRLGNRRRRICVIKRSSRDAPWEKPSLLYGTEDHVLGYPFVGNNGTLLLASTSEKTIKVFKRASIDRPFEFQGLVGSNDKVVNGFFPRYCVATRELFFAGIAPNRNDTELFVLKDFSPSQVTTPSDVSQHNRSTGKKASDTAVIERVRIQLSEKGTLRVWVNGKDDLVNKDGVANAVEAFGDARVTKLEDGRMAVTYDFSQKQYSGFPVGSDRRLSVSDEQGAALLMPGEKRPNEIPLAKPSIGPVDFEIDLLGIDRGTFQIFLRSGDEIAVIGVFGGDEGGLDGGSATVSVRRRGKWSTMSKFRVVESMAKPIEVQVGRAFQNKRTQLSFGLVGNEPVGITRILAIGHFPASFGAQFQERGNNLLVIRVVKDSASDGVLKVGDVLVAVSGKPVSGMKEALQSLALCQIGEPVELTVRRLGKPTTVKLTPR